MKVFCCKTFLLYSECYQLISVYYFVHLQLTFVDFLWYELLEVLDAIDPTLLPDHSNLSSFRKRFQACYVMQFSLFYQMAHSAAHLQIHCHRSTGLCTWPESHSEASVLVCQKRLSPHKMELISLSQIAVRHCFMSSWYYLLLWCNVSTSSLQITSSILHC